MKLSLRPSTFTSRPGRLKRAVRCGCAALVAAFGLSGTGPHRAAAQTPLAKSDAPTREMAFDFSQGVVLLNVDLGGKRPARLVFDTGNNHSALDIEAAREIGLDLPESGKKTRGSGPDAMVYYLVAPTRLRLSEADLALEPMFVAALRKSLVETGVACDGTIGYDAFKEMAVQIDFPARKLRLLGPADTGAAAAQGTAFPITWKKYWSRSPDLVTVENLRVGDHVLCAQVDTFLAHTAILFSTKLPWLKTTPFAGAAPVRYEEASLAPVRVEGDLALGDCRTTAQTPVFLAGADAHVPETEIAAVLGNGFFAGRVVTFDFAASRLILGPRANP